MFSLWCSYVVVICEGGECPSRESSDVRVSDLIFRKIDPPSLRLWTTRSRISLLLIVLPYILYAICNTPIQKQTRTICDTPILPIYPTNRQTKIVLSTSYPLLSTHPSPTTLLPQHPKTHSTHTHLPRIPPHTINSRHPTPHPLTTITFQHKPITHPPVPISPPHLPNARREPEFLSRPFQAHITRIVRQVWTMRWPGFVDWKRE